jgi:hypothetical protein
VLDLNVALRDIESLLRRLIGEDVQLTFSAGRDLWRVSMDPSQLDQTLTNLAVNARDADAFGGRLTIETRNVVIDERYCASPPRRARRRVRDGRGLGLRLRHGRSTLDRAFEPFFTTKPEGEGTGLGLSTVYGVARQNGGTVNLYSEPGRGTTVRVYLPRHRGAAQARPEAAPAPLRRGAERILLVEDEAALLALTEETADGARLRGAVGRGAARGDRVRVEAGAAPRPAADRRHHALDERQGALGARAGPAARASACCTRPGTPPTPSPTAACWSPGSTSWRSPSRWTRWPPDPRGARSAVLTAAGGVPG